VAIDGFRDLPSISRVSCRRLPGDHDQQQRSEK
jgi:hypothetical protein